MLSILEGPDTTSGAEREARLRPTSALAALPDFEVGQLRLRPRFSAVDLGEVEPVRLKVDVHVLCARPVSPGLQNAKGWQLLWDLFLT